MHQNYTHEGPIDLNAHTWKLQHVEDKYHGMGWPKTEYFVCGWTLDKTANVEVADDCIVFID